MSESVNGISPAGRTKVTLGDIARNISVNEYSPKEKGLDRCVGLEHLNPGSLKIYRWSPITPEMSFTRRFYKGQILFGKRRAYQKKVALADFDGICSSDILVIEAKKENFVPELLPFIIQDDRFFEYAVGTSSGSLSPRTKWKFLAEYKIWLPSLDEQHRITTTLWAAEDCIVNGELFLAAAERAKRILMLELFDSKKGSLDIRPPELLKKSSKSFEIVNLGDKKYFKLMTGGTPFTKKSEYWDGDIPWLLSGEVNNRRIYNTEKKITELGFQNSNATVVPIHSVLIALAGQGKTRGSVAINEIELTTNQSVAAIVPNNEKIDSFYLYYILESLYDEIRSYSGKEGRGGLSLSSIGKINLPIPILEKQKKIAHILTRCDETIAATRANVAAAKTLKMKMITEFLNS